MVKSFWFRITYQGSTGKPRSPGRRAGKSFANKLRTETVLYIGESLASVLADIDAAQRGRLAHDPGGYRIVRYSAIYSPPLDPAFKLFIDETLRLENNRVAASL